MSHIFSVPSEYFRTGIYNCVCLVLILRFLVSTRRHTLNNTNIFCREKKDIVENKKGYTAVEFLGKRSTDALCLPDTSKSHIWAFFNKSVTFRPKKMENQLV